MSATGRPATGYRVGLTGGLASGKSTVAGWLRDAGFQVIDADRLVADLYRPGAAGAAAVSRLFGGAVLTPEGGVDHAALAARVFADAAARQALEQAIHPLVRRRFEEIAAAPADAAPPAPGSPPAATDQPPPAPDPSPPSADSPTLVPESPPPPAPDPPPATDQPPATDPPPPPAPVTVLEATLLVEAGYGPGFDLIVTVEGDPEERLRRAIARGLDPTAARARLAAQGDGARRRQGAQRVLHNDGTLADLRRQADALIADIRRAAAAAAAAAADRVPASPPPPTPLPSRP
ncbi:MAG TPA: dephospho-CoA kinase [Thermoanaerobaculia bacterium]|nr:dephospho-CoA kinase [Thermoanaerobaculia bacterium]